MSQGLANADSFEIVILVGEQQTIHFRIFPKYKGIYVSSKKDIASAAEKHERKPLINGIEFIPPVQ